MKVSAQYASQHFEDLILAVDNGEVVEIARAEKPTLKLVSSMPTKPSEQKGPRKLGVGKAFAQLPGIDELERIDQEWKSELDAKAFSR